MLAHLALDLDRAIGELIGFGLGALAGVGVMRRRQPEETTRLSVELEAMRATHRLSVAAWETRRQLTDAVWHQTHSVDADVVERELF
jgi:hypothetical protein